MDRLSLLNQRSEAAGKTNSAVVSFINTVADELSFVETDKYSRGTQDSGFGSGVVTGYCTIAGVPVCIAVQNIAVAKGGFSRANADKILKCHTRAQNSGAVMLTVFDSLGASLTDGAEVLDAYADVIAGVSNTWENTHISVIRGSSLGANNYIAGLSDIVITYKGATVATQSPLAFAKQKGFDGKSMVKSGFADFCVENDGQLAALLADVLGKLSDSGSFDESLLNKAPHDFSAYNSGEIISHVFDGGNSFLQFKEDYGQELICGLAVIGGAVTGAIICGDDENGTEISWRAADKAARFVRLLDKHALPLITFVNCSGTKVDEDEGMLIRSVSALTDAVCDHSYSKISVICGKASGAGYIALASKSLGYDSMIAWATADISAISKKAGTMMYLSQMENIKDTAAAKAQAEELYSESADPFRAASGLSIDNIIHPKHTRQYVLSALTQTF